MKFKNSIIVLAVSLSLGLACEGDTPAPLITNASSFEFVWDKIDSVYPFFETRDIDWDQVKLDYGSRVTESMDMTDYRDLLIEMTLLLEDGQTGIEFEGDLYTYSGEPISVDSRPVNRESYLTNVTTNSNYVVVGDIKDKNVRYIAIKTLSPHVYQGFYQPLIEAIYQYQWESYNGLIIDIRELVEAEEYVSYDITRFLFSESTVYRRYRERNGSARNSLTAWTDDSVYGEGRVTDKPVIFLTGRHNKNGAEDFALKLKAIPNALQIGDTTAGNLSNPVGFRIPHGWPLIVSSQQITDLEGNMIEGLGIIPDEAIQISEADRNAGKDTILEAAIDKFE